jgi:hypothetical protein
MEIRDGDDRHIDEAVQFTQILRPPRQSLETFGTTNVRYFLLTEPVYKETTMPFETVIREGRVIAERPRIVTPYYLTNLEGFSFDARRYFERMLEEHGSHAPGLLYTYKNEPKELNIVCDNLPCVARRLNEEIERQGDPLTSIIRGADTLWDVSLLKFIYEMTRRSVQSNLRQLGARGLLSMDNSGLPLDARLGIEEMFHKTAHGESAPGDLKAELDRWGVFAEYEDRFLALFRKGHQ